MLRVLRHSSSGTSVPELYFGSSQKLAGLTIRHGTHSTYYHRTARGAAELCHPKTGELRSFFSSPERLHLFAKGQSILDVGCGAGTLARNLQGSAILAVGLDFYLDETQANQEYLVQGDAYRLPFISESFSCLISSWSAFHFEPISSLSQLLSEAARVLVPYGSLYLSPIQELERIHQLKNAGNRLNLRVVQCLQTGALRFEKI